MAPGHYLDQCWFITIWTLWNDDLSLMEPLGINFSEIIIKIQTFSFIKMHFKLSSAECWPFWSSKTSQFLNKQWIHMPKIWVTISLDNNLPCSRAIFQTDGDLASTAHDIEHEICRNSWPWLNRKMLCFITSIVLQITWDNLIPPPPPPPPPPKHTHTSTTHHHHAFSSF